MSFYFLSWQKYEKKKYQQAKKQHKKDLHCFFTLSDLH